MSKNYIKDYFIYINFNTWLAWIAFVNISRIRLDCRQQWEAAVENQKKVASQHIATQARVAQQLSQVPEAGSK